MTREKSDWEIDLNQVDIRHLDIEWFDERYTYALSSFVSDYQKYGPDSDSSFLIQQFLKDIARTHDTSGYFNKRFFDDVLRGMDMESMQRKFTQEMFALQFAKEPADLTGCLSALYKPYTQYIAEAAVQLGAYVLVMEWTAAVFQMSFAQPYNSQYRRDDCFFDPYLIADKLCRYIEFLDYPAAKHISKVKKEQFLNQFSGHLHEARALLELL